MATKTFTVTAPDDTMEKLEAFFSMLHFNGGHSGIFGITFDGDGHESAKFDPEPPKFHAGGQISGVGTDAEIVTSKDVCTGYSFKNDKKWVARGDEKAETMVYKDSEGWVPDEAKKQYAQVASPAMPKIVPPWKSNNMPSATPPPQARPQQPQQQQQRPAQQPYNPKADWVYIEPRLKRMGILPGSFEYAQWERIKNQGPEAVLKYVGNLEKQYYGRVMATNWVKKNCKFAQ